MILYIGRIIFIVVVIVVVVVVIIVVAIVVIIIVVAIVIVIVVIINGYIDVAKYIVGKLGIKVVNICTVDFNIIIGIVDVV